MTPKNLPIIRDQNRSALHPVEAALRASAPPMQSSSAAVHHESGPDWRRIASALMRFKWVVLLALVLGVGAAFAATRVLPPVYKAQANVWIDAPDSRRPDPATEARGPIRQGALLDADAWVELLKSYVVLDQVVRDMRLYLEVQKPADRPNFVAFRVNDTFRPGEYRLRVSGDGRRYTLADAKGQELERATVGDSIGKALGIRWAPAAGSLPPDRTIEFAMVSPRDAATRLGEQLGVRMDLNGNFLALELRGTNPVLIAGILNAVTQRYVEVAAQLKRDKLTELTKLLQDQLSTAQRNLDDAENALVKFRTRTITLPSERTPGDVAAGGATGDPVRATFFDMQLERDQLRRDREAIDQLLTDAGSSGGGLAIAALAAVQSVQQSPELSSALKELSEKEAQLRAYRYQYSEAYPPLQRLNGQVVDLQQRTIPTLARKLSAQLLARESQVGRQVDAASGDLRQIPGRTIEEARLDRNAQLKEQTYTALQQRYDAARLAAEATVPDVRILDPATVPQRPFKNTTRRLLLMGLLGGLAVGIVGAVVLDRVDPKLRYPEQISRDMGLPILAAVPHLRSKEPQEVVEALRGVRLSVLHEHGPAPVVITITSPEQGDGKSFVSANLALAFADGGHNTLLIDADIRRGVLHRRFKANRQPGLADFLLGDIGPDQLIQQTAFPRLGMIGCGTRTQRAPEVLGSTAMSDLITDMRARYDVVVVDSPPLAAGVDSFVLGTLTGTMLLVVRTGHSHRQLTSAKLEMLARLPIRLLGAVLNDVPRGAAYGYYAYYSYYLPGYEAVDEQNGRQAAAPRLV